MSASKRKRWDGIFRNAAFAFLTSVTFLSMSFASHAATLFQSVPDLYFTPPNADYCDTCAGGQQMFDTFTLGSNSDVTSITFDVSNLLQFFPNPQSVPITVGIYSVGSGGGPGTTLFSQTFTSIPTNVNVNLSFGTALITFDPTNLALSAGNYIISYYSLDGLGAIGFANGGTNQAFAVATPGTSGPI